MLNHFQGFSQQQQILLASFFIFGALMLLMHLKGKQLWFYVFLACGAFSLFCFAALLDPFLNLWDERFHALVGKNSMHHFLKPTLYDNPVVDMAYDRWDRYTIWLHKQPLFLWQIALSFKFFGISEFSLRLPSVILSTVLVLITYRSGQVLVNKNVGFLAAILIMTSLYLVELIAGRQELEQNDISFLAYVSISIWALIEYNHSKKKYWIAVIGFSAGLAILCKWLVGLTIYFGWTILRLLEKKYRLKENLDFILALMITIVVALPWQVVSFMWYPAEAASAMHYNSLHFSQVIEGHGGDHWYHFDQIGAIYGKLVPYIILPALYMFYRKLANKKLAVALISIILIIYLFFTLAKTKMPSFSLPVAMLMVIAIACFIDSLIIKLQKGLPNRKIKSILFIASILGLLFMRLDIALLKERHLAANSSYARTLMQNKAMFMSLDLPENAVLFNVKGRHYIEAMFYTGFPAYAFLPTEEQCEELVKKGKIAVIFVKDEKDLPSFLSDASNVLLLDKKVLSID